MSEKYSILPHYASIEYFSANEVKRSEKSFLPADIRPCKDLSRSNHPQQGTTTVTITGDFSLRFEMTAGGSN